MNMRQSAVVAALGSCLLLGLARLGFWYWGAVPEVTVMALDPHHQNLAKADTNPNYFHGYAVRVRAEIADANDRQALARLAEYSLGPEVDILNYNGPRIGRECYGVRVRCPAGTYDYTFTEGCHEVRVHPEYWRHAKADAATKLPQRLDQLLRERGVAVKIPDE